MKNLSWRARAYLSGSYAAGVGALTWLMLREPGRALGVGDWLLATLLAVVASICQVFVVQRTSTTGQRSDHLTPAPILAALVLLPSPLLALVLILTWLPEWYVYRRTWYPQLWNIAAYLIAGALASAGYAVLTGGTAATVLATSPIAVLALPVLFLGTQTLLLAWVLKLARGQSFQTSGLFEPGKLLTEFGTACVGLAFALVWQLHPWYGLVAGLPLLLIFQALHVPNLKEEASTDAKTGLANMRHFEAEMARVLERAGRTATPCSLLVADLDYLRNINNTYGHQAGDTVLRGIADILRRQIGKEDVAARYGGEEFVVLLAQHDHDAALELAERVRRELEDTRFDVKHMDGGIGATISIGVATYPRDGRTGDTLFHEADLAVYQAKRDGRNRVVGAGRQSRELAAEWAREHLVASSSPVSTTQSVGGAVWQLINQATRTSINTGRIPQAEPAAVLATAAATKPQLPARGGQAAGPSWAVGTLIGTIVAAALVSVTPGLLDLTYQQVSWWPLLIFTGLTIAASEMAVDTYGKGKTSVATVAKLAAAMLLGDLGILLTALAAAIVLKLKARSPLHRMAFNFGTFVLAAQGAQHLFQLLIGPTVDARPLAVQLPAAAGAGLAFYAINHLLLCLVRGLNDRQSPWTIWRADYLWLWPHYIVLGALALIVALNYQAFGALGAAAVMIPAAMMHLAIKQYMARTAVHVAELRQMNQQLTDSYEATLQALTRALDTRDEETEEHSQRVKRYTQLIAQRLRISSLELDDMLRGALLHDIGKIGVPDAILLKPGKLNAEEQAIMRRHPEIGYNMIVHIPFLAGAARVVLHHHEAYDGTGYPSQLAGAQIPMGARIFAVADTFDAMTSDRPYRRALAVATARAEIERCRGTQFDPAIVDAFLAIPISELLAARSPDGPVADIADELAAVPRGLPALVLAQH